MTTPGRFRAALSASLLVMSLPLWGQTDTTAVTFENAAAAPALVKVVGPTSASFRVAAGGKFRMGLRYGRYHAKIRFGGAGKFQYRQSQAFTVADRSEDKALTIQLLLERTKEVKTTTITEAQFGAVDVLGRGRGKAVDLDPPGGPSWAHIVLDEKLFPKTDGKDYWDRVREAYLAGTAGDKDDVLMTDIDSGVEPAKLIAKYGAPEETRRDNNGVTWHYFGAFSLGFKKGEKTYTQIQAATGFFEKGFHRKSRFAQADKEDSEDPPPPNKGRRMRQRQE